MRLPTDTGGPTEPMEPLLSEATSVPRHASRAPRLPRLQSMYYIVAIIVLLVGELATLAMRFGWFDHLLAGAGSPPAAARSWTAPVPHNPLAEVLAQDTFARPDQSLWGMAASGQSWLGDANRSPAFTIAGHVGRISGGQGFFDALLGQLRTNEEVETSASLTRFNGGRDNIGAVLRFADTNDYYKAYLDGAHLVVMKRVAGQTTVLSTIPFAAQDGVSYSLRFRASGMLLMARAWPTGGREPAAWMTDVSDQSLTTGIGGLRVLLESGVAVSVTSFRELAVADQ
jgi:hypothetical protein